MYNGIGLRTVRGSGTNGYVQRNLSYVNASRTRQTLMHNQRGGALGDVGARGDGKNRPPPNVDILLHEQKRKVELQVLEMSLEMENRGCEDQEIQDKVKRERARLLTRLLGGGDEGREKDAESSHARQKRKEEENQRITDAFGIASDYIAGESFDPEMQERRRHERKERKEQERKEREEARQVRLKTREDRDKKMRARRERFHSKSRSSLVTRSRRSRSPPDRRSRGRDDARSRKSPSRSAVTERRSRRSLALDERKRRSVSSSRSRSRSSHSRSRSHSRTLRKGKRHGKDSLATKKVKRSRFRSASRSDSDTSSDSESDCSRERSCRKNRTVTKGKTVPSPPRSAVLKGKDKVLNLSKRSTSTCAVTDGEVRVHSDTKEEKRSVLSPEREKSPVVAMLKREVKHETFSEEKVDKAQVSLTAALPVRVKEEGKTEVPRSPRRLRSPAADSWPQSRKRKDRSLSPEGRRRRGRSTSSALSKASCSPRFRRMRSHLAPSDRSRSPSSDSSRSRSRACSRSRQRSIPRRRRRSPSRSRSRSRGRDRSNPRSHRY